MPGSLWVYPAKHAHYAGALRTEMAITAATMMSAAKVSINTSRATSQKSFKENSSFVDGATLMLWHR
jgi:hypothetical protein